MVAEKSVCSRQKRSKQPAGAAERATESTKEPHKEPETYRESQRGEPTREPEIAATEVKKEPEK